MCMYFIKISQNIFAWKKKGWEKSSLFMFLLHCSHIYVVFGSWKLPKTVLKLNLWPVLNNIIFFLKQTGLLFVAFKVKFAIHCICIYIAN